MTSTLPGTAALAIACTLAGAALFCGPDKADLEPITKMGFPAGDSEAALAANVAAWQSEDPDAKAATACSYRFVWLPGNEPCQIAQRGERGHVQIYIPRTHQFLWCNSEALTTHETQHQSP